MRMCWCGLYNDFQFLWLSNTNVTGTVYVFDKQAISLNYTHYTHLLMDRDNSMQIVNSCFNGAYGSSVV